MTDGHFAHVVADGDSISLLELDGETLAVPGDPAATARVVDFTAAGAAWDAELAVRVRDEEELATVLEELDPELLVLAGTLDAVLELLEDVPAGKLAIAELTAPTDGDVEELERAGMDAVIVRGRQLR